MSWAVQEYDRERILEPEEHEIDLDPRKSIFRGSKHAVQVSKGTWHLIKLRERNGPSRGIIQKCAPHERSPCAPKFGERSHEETLHQHAQEFGQNYVL